MHFPSFKFSEHALAKNNPNGTPDNPASEKNGILCQRTTLGMGRAYNRVQAFCNKSPCINGFLLLKDFYKTARTLTGQIINK